MGKNAWIKTPLHCKCCGKYMRDVDWPRDVQLPDYHCNDCPPLEAKQVSGWLNTMLGRQ